MYAFPNSNLQVKSKTRVNVCILWLNFLGHLAKTREKLILKTP